MPDVAWTCGDRCSWELSEENRTVWDFSLHAPLAAAKAAVLRRAYNAAVAFLDSEVGRVLTSLDDLGFRKSTLVTMFGDHGWGLGEGNFWHKFSNMEHSARVPLLIRAPWLPGGVGTVVEDLVELVDIFPTVASLVGTPKPVYKNSTLLPLDGTDFSALVAGRAGSTAGYTPKEYVFSQFPRCDGHNTSMAAANYCKSTKDKDLDYMGYSIRDSRFRYTLWLKWNGTLLQGKWNTASSGGVGEELYDHSGDDGSSFDAYPVGWKSLAADAKYAKDKLRLRKALQAFFDKSA